MTPWKYTDSTNTVVFRINEDGGTESCLASAIDWTAEGVSPLHAYQADQNSVIQSKIDQIERDTLMNRGCREGWIALIEQQATAQGITQDQLLDPATGNPFFRKLVETDNAVRALRSQLT